jgi:alpha-N-arabinofuranosidase
MKFAGRCCNVSRIHLSGGNLGMQTTVHLDTHHHVGEIDRRIFGGFLEHLGRAVYEGVYDPGNPLSDERGFRKDVLDILKPLDMPVVRYPGGNFVSCYDWKDGVGPREQRPTKPDYAWRSRETNQFGTDEFMTWCKAVGTEPMMAVNLGTLGTAAAGELVEYCNLPTGTFWADQRKANGHADPYGVKLWCLGNEMDGIWQAGHVPADEYARRAMQASVMMKGLDRSIQTIAAGSSGRFMSTYMHWDRTVLEFCWDQIDFISAHRYSNNDRQDSAWFLAEGIEIDRVIEDYAGLLAYVRGVKRSNKQIYLSFDEWNVWYKDRNGDGNWAAAPHLLEEVYNLEDALVCAQYLSSFIRHADVVKLACIAQIVNVIAPVLTRKEGSLIQSIYYPFLLYSQHAVGVSLKAAVTTGTYKAGERGDAPAVDVSASYDAATQQLSLFLINRDQAGPATVNVHLADAKIEKILTNQSMGGGDVKAANTWEMPERVKPFAGQAAMDGNGLRIQIPAPGLAVVRCQVSRT